jgi:hypothetical protein
VALYERLVGRTDEGVAVDDKIHIHTFMAALGELERGSMTNQQVIDAFALTAPEQTELTAMTDKLVGFEEAFSLGSFITLTNIGASYDATAASRGLPALRLECGGINALEFGVRWNKIGVGTLSWQLWDETAGSEVTVINDSVAGDNKAQVATRTFSPPAPRGVRTLRVRGKSTTAADDPVFYGASCARMCCMRCFFWQRTARPHWLRRLL